MIIEIQQIQKTENAYKCFIQGENVCDIFCPYQKGRKVEHFVEFFITGKKMRLYFCAMDGTYGKSAKERFTTHILVDGQCVGGMVGDESEYGVYNIEYYDKKYTAYMVELGIDDEDYICIYDNLRTLVAEIRRTRFPEREFDYYVAFTRDEALLELLCLIPVYLDSIIFNHTGAMGEGLYGVYGCRDGVKYHHSDFVTYIAAEEGFDLNKRIFAPVEDLRNMTIQFDSEAMQKSEKYRDTSHKYFTRIVGAVLTVIAITVTIIIFGIII